MRFDCTIKRIAVFALQRDDLRKLIDCTGFLKMFERLDHTDKERAVAYRHDDVRRNAPELLKRFVDVRLHALVEEWVIDMVGVVSTFIAYLGAANVSTMITRARYHIDFGAVRFNHANF